MKKPALILTGENAGRWYQDTIDRLVSDGRPLATRPSQYHTVTTDFELINALLPWNMREAARMLEPYFVQCEEGRKPYVLANITLHEAVSYFSFQPQYFIDIENILRQECIAPSIRVGILGTSYTMTNPYWQDVLPANADIVPLPKDIVEGVDRLRLLYFSSRDQCAARYQFSQLAEYDAVDLWILACTELAMALDDADIKLPVLHLPYLQCLYLYHAMIK